MIEALFFIPVGPNDGERVANTVESIRMHCDSAYRIHLIVDGLDPSSLPAQCTATDIRIHLQSPPTKGNWGKIWRMQCLAMSEMVSDVAVSSNAVFVKIDADALVLRSGLVKRAQAIFNTRPRTGQIGQCFSTILGDGPTNAGWDNFMRKMAGWRGIRDFITGGIKHGDGLYDGLTAFCKCRALMKLARANGYRGTVASGGAYILRRDVINDLARGEFFQSSPFSLLEMHLPGMGEDVIMTLYVYAAGYAAIDDSADDGIFAIEGKELRISPFVLKERGHYIIHPTKYGYRSADITLNEAELVAALNYITDDPVI